MGTEQTQAGFVSQCQIWLPRWAAKQLRGMKARRFGRWRLDAGPLYVLRSRKRGDRDGPFGVAWYFSGLALFSSLLLFSSSSPFLSFFAVYLRGNCLGKGWGKANTHELWRGAIPDMGTISLTGCRRLPPLLCILSVSHQAPSAVARHL